jgi:hypothetical protein
MAFRSKRVMPLRREAHRVRQTRVSRCRLRMSTLFQCSRSLSESCHSAAANDLPASASFSARNSPGRLTISAARTNMVATYSSHRAPSTYSLGKEHVLARLGRAGVIGYASGFFQPVASHLPASPFPGNEGLLGQTPSIFMTMLSSHALLLTISLLQEFPGRYTDV